MSNDSQDEDDLWTSAARMAAAPPGPRRLLPHDLDLSLKYLSEGELQRLAEAVAFEIRRRKVAQAQERKPATALPLQDSGKDQVREVAGLTSAQVNLIRASIKAGVKPTALQRQFGVTRSQITAAMKEG